MVLGSQVPKRVSLPPFYCPMKYVPLKESVSVLWLCCFWGFSFVCFWPRPITIIHSKETLALETPVWHGKGWHALKALLGRKRRPEVTWVRNVNGCYRSNARVPQNSNIELLTVNVMVLGGGTSGRWIGHLNGISVLIKKTPESSLTPPPCEVRERRWRSLNQDKFLHQEGIFWHLDLGLLWEINVCCSSDPVYDISVIVA